MYEWVVCIVLLLHVFMCKNDSLLVAITTAYGCHCYAVNGSLNTKDNPKFVMWYRIRFHLNVLYHDVKDGSLQGVLQMERRGSGTKQNPELHLNRYFRLEEHQLLKSFCFSSKILKISHGRSRILQVKATRISAIEGV